MSLNPTTWTIMPHLSIQDRPTSISIHRSISTQDTTTSISIQLQSMLAKYVLANHLNTLPSISTKKLRTIQDTPQPTQDRISDLPDAILCHILSFLPTHSAVRTTILSKRWKPIWLSLTTFNMFDLFQNYLLLSAMQAMLSRTILSFRLMCTFPEIVDELIFTASKRGVQSIELDLLYSSLEMKSLSNIHSCNTLTVLKLTDVTIKEDFPRINVSFIKTLDLDDVIFKRAIHMINFFLAFSSLEELHTNLVYVLGRMEFIPYLMVNCLPNLLRANISDIELTPFFHLSRSLILNLNKRPLLNIAHLPVLHNLTQLELVFNFEQTWHAKWKWILKILQQSPNLQHLTIHQVCFIENESGINEKIWEDPLVVPECLSSQLRTCLFRLWRGTKCELKFVEYIMRNSKVLSSMTIRCSSSNNINTKKEILHKLSFCPRECKLIFG